MVKFFEQSDFSWNRKFLEHEKINYIYASKSELNKPLDIKKNNLEIFFENDEVLIYKFIGVENIDFSAGKYSL